MRRWKKMFFCHSLSSSAISEIAAVAGLGISHLSCTYTHFSVCVWGGQDALSVILPPSSSWLPCNVFYPDFCHADRALMNH